MQNASESLPDVPPGARPAARVILINPDKRILLLEAFEEGTDHVWWVMPGGGLLPGETFAEAAVRETLEETGLSSEVSGCVWTRHHIYEGWGRSFNQFERFFVGHTDNSSVIAGHHRSQDSYVRGHRWWSLDEIQASDQDFSPRRLAGFLPAILDGIFPTEPVDVGV